MANWKGMQRGSLDLTQSAEDAYSLIGSRMWRAGELSRRLGMARTNLGRQASAVRGISGFSPRPGYPNGGLFNADGTWFGFSNPAASWGGGGGSEDTSGSLAILSSTSLYITDESFETQHQFTGVTGATHQGPPLKTTNGWLTFIDNGSGFKIARCNTNGTITNLASVLGSTFYGIYSCASAFIAVSSDTQHRFYTSTNGSSWSAPSVMPYLYAGLGNMNVAGTGSGVKVIAQGTGTNGRVASFDGTSWSVSANSTGNNCGYLCIDCGISQTVGAEDYGSPFNVRLDTEGAAQVISGYTGQSPTRIFSGNNTRMVVTGSGTIFKSTGGESFILSMTGATSLLGFARGFFYALYPVGAETYIAKSEDGTGWDLTDTTVSDLGYVPTYITAG